jgi:hypothetical protein
MILVDAGQEIKEKTTPGVEAVVAFIPGKLGSRRLFSLRPYRRDAGATKKMPTPQYGHLNTLLLTSNGEEWPGKARFFPALRMTNV